MKPIRLYFIRLILNFIPETRLFNLKRILYRWAGLKLGKNVRICSSVFFLGIGKIEIGADTWIGHRTTIISTSNVKIGCNVDIGPNVYIGTGSHQIEPQSMHIAGKGISKDIFINDGCWIGAGSIVLPGISIGEKVVIAAGSVVNKDIPTYTIAAGVPAIPIKSWNFEKTAWDRID